jgi:polyphosphate glucokinase
MATLLGIDIGGTGIKGAPVDTARGELTADRLRILTPPGAKPQDVAKVVSEVVGHFDSSGPIGCTFPAVIQHGVARTAANVDPSWIGTDAQQLLSASTGRPTVVVNDADAAGIAEMQFGAGKGVKGTVLLLTLGTGIGSALFFDGELVPNTELGHLEVHGHEAEKRASEKVREDEDMSWDKWAKRLDDVLQTYEALLCPDLMILGGGASKKFDKFSEHLHTRTKVVPAELLNEAGIVGAALAAARS